MKLFLFISLIVFQGSIALSYSEFIAVGYTQCAVCHYNSAGGGALTDYGRALFASEIARKPFWNLKATDEELGQSSNFLGEKELPYFIRPGIKYRGLYFKSNPGSKKAIEKYVNMQTDLNLAIILDRKMNWLVMLAGGIVPTPSGASANRDEERRNLISKEVYLRTKVGQKVWTYFGILDKVFGIRNPDHTVFSRKATQIAQNDQVLGLAINYSTKGEDIWVHLFDGNPWQNADLRARGLSLMYERDLAEKIRVGSSLLYQKNSYVDQIRLGGYLKRGTSDNAAFILEGIFLEDRPKSGTRSLGGIANLGYSQFLTRGLIFSSYGEYYKKSFIQSESEQLRWHIGLIYWPFQRFEWRNEVVQSKTFASTKTVTPSTTLSSQIHLSF